MIFFLFIGCEKDNFTEQVEIEQNTNKSQIEYITYKNVPQVINTITSLTGKSSLKTYSFGKGIDYKKAFIDLNSILKVQNTKGIINYSFNILMENAPVNEFYNLIVNEGIKGERNTPYVIKYVVDEDARDVFMANKRDFHYFKGKQHIMSFDSFFDGFNTSTNRATGDCPEEVVPIDNTGSTGADGNFYNITGDNFLQTDPSAYEYAPTVILGDSYEIFLNSINTVSLGNTSFTAIVRDAIVPISFTSQPLSYIIYLV